MPLPEELQQQLKIVNGEPVVTGEPAFMPNGNHQYAPEPEPEQSLFKVKEANQWIEESKGRPIPKKLFGEFWHEGEVCIFFADTNLGKSILAVQIGEAIARGESLAWFDIEVEPQNVLYCDFELSDKQFEIRYAIKDGDYCKDHYEFSPRFFRAEINPFTQIPDRYKKFEDFIVDSLEQTIVEFNIKVVIIDNITWLRSEAEKAKDAISLMQYLQMLATKLEISLLALAHTPKRDSTKPLGYNDLGGSKQLSNFCDSMFAMGQSQQDEHLRYLKQLKVRDGEKLYGETNVSMCQIQKVGSFLGFEFLDFAEEMDHLKRLTQSQRDEMYDRARQLRAQGMSLRSIERTLGVSKSTVSRLVGGTDEAD